MNDLISRSKLINDIVIYLFSDKCNLNELAEDIREIIDSEPTAYSVEKVVDELGKLKSNLGFGGTLQIMYADNKIDEAIEIVKRGSLSE